MRVVLLSRLGRTPTFLVPIINPPFADTAGTPAPVKTQNMLLGTSNIKKNENFIEHY